VRGTDQGTVVFPDAGCKFFLTADSERASPPAGWTTCTIPRPPIDEDELRRRSKQRDERDAPRVETMRPAVDAIVLDRTRLTVDAVVEHMEQAVRKRLG